VIYPREKKTQETKFNLRLYTNEDPYFGYFSDRKKGLYQENSKGIPLEDRIKIFVATLDYHIHY